MKIDNILDHGYVRLVDKMGTDLTIVNTARVSFEKESPALTLNDENLIDFVIEHRHDSCLRHCVMTFEVYAPMMVKNQWIKHMVASAHVEDQNGWNESCLPAWQEVWSYDNKRYTVQDIIDGKQIPLRSLSNGKIVPNRVKDIWQAGEAEVLSITDEFGNKVSGTANHRVLTDNGYVMLGMLAVGDTIAHNLIHGKRPMVAGYGKITSIESMGVWPVYDIAMELEDNFVAGGIIVHNSRRYVTENEIFYIPKSNEWRQAPANKKQGSGECFEEYYGKQFAASLEDHVAVSVRLYEAAMERGVAPEQARLFLPAYGLYIRWRWTASLNAIFNFLEQRLDGHAQKEIRDYAAVVKEMVNAAYPTAYNAWERHRR